MDIGTVVERLIQERGQLDPLVFLQEIGVVSRTGITAWRQGKVGCLRDVIQGDLSWIEGCLRQAARMARTLGLVPKTIDASRMDNDGRHLGLQIDTTHDPGRDALFTTHYLRPPQGSGGIQMDLFLDTPETALVNDLIHAIANHDATLANHLFMRLEKNHPDNQVLNDLPPLIKAITDLEALIRSPLEGLDRLQNELTTHARQGLGGLEGRFLKPFYLLFDKAFAGRPFDPQHPNAHRSWTLERLGHWKALSECVLLEPGWTRQPVLLLRRAKALFQLRRLEANRRVWIRFFWELPQQAAQYLETHGDKDLKRLWNGFIDREVSDWHLFPTWILLDQPRLAKDPDAWSETEEEETTPSPGQTAFFTLANLLLAEEETPTSSQSMIMRRQLKESFPEVFAMFMQTIRPGQTSS
ncbi:MAG: hypothetical protein HQL83_04200 [Magnetococcales bacterium]|nr:hypothetical protein [Magnetococcales bacterium]